MKAVVLRRGRVASSTGARFPSTIKNSLSQGHSRPALGGGSGGTRDSEEVRAAKLAGSSPPFLGRERAAVSVDVDPERRSPR